MIYERFEKLNVPNEEEQKELFEKIKLLPELFLDRYLTNINICNRCISTINMLQEKLEDYVLMNKLSEIEIDSLKKQNQELMADINSLQLQLQNIPQVGRPKKYDANNRKLIVDFYNESKEHTYIVTSTHFKISTSTLKDILNEARTNGIFVRARNN